MKDASVSRSQPVESESTIAQGYPGKDLEAMSFAVNYHRWIVEEFDPYLGETVAEVGAGMGSVSRLLLERGVTRLVAFEPSHNMYMLLQKALAHDPRASAVNDFFGPSYARQMFDSVVYINVLEHIENDRAELLNSLEALRPQGHLLLFVPALSWLYADLDRQIGHFRRYAKAELVNLVRDVGFTVVKARYFDMAGIAPWYVSFVLLRNTIGRGSVALYDKLVVPMMKRVEGLLAPPIGKNVLLIARRG